MGDRFRYVRGTLLRGDRLRPLLTDTSPYEVPIIFSNDGFYKNLRDITSRSETYRAMVSKLITDDDHRFTIPFRFKVAKDEISVRNLSLPHPYSQYRTSEFYVDNSTLIAHYCSRGSFSIRYPVKVGSTFYFKSDLSDENAYKKSGIDTTELDRFVRNPASYFSYAGYPRLYKFFSSSEYLRMERRFSKMQMIDVSKCFNSIYTHSIAWAIKGDQHSKDHKNAKMFGNAFDRLMQKMNYDETSGICIGPEASRIFAEVILSAIDVSVEKNAASLGLRLGRDYMCRRYVDDFIVFANSDTALKIITQVIEACLAKYKLSINEQKIRRFSRPFLTDRSHTVAVAQASLQAYLNAFVEQSGRTLYPKRIYRSKGLLMSLLNPLKIGCIERKVTYDAVANFVISVLVKRVERLIRDFSDAVHGELADVDSYPPALLSLLEAAFFLYTVNPTVASSYALSRAVLSASDHVKLNHADEFISFRESVLFWGRQLTEALLTDEASRIGKVPIEAINLALACAEIDPDFVIDGRHLRSLGLSTDSSDYFSLITGLYLCGDDLRNVSIRDGLVRRARTVLTSGLPLTKDSQKAHLLLDFLSCPFVEAVTRVAMLEMALDELGVPKPPAAAMAVLLSEFESNHWFVNWRGISLLALVRKKELSSVY